MDNWDYMKNWEYVLPPSRPSDWQLDCIRSICRELSPHAPVAVLGSTPEYRDVLFECGFRNIYVLDRNIGFHNAMSKLRIYDNDETLAVGDWLETLDGFPQSFSLILSDLTSGNIAYGARERFYDLISRALPVGGYFFDKVLTHSGPNIAYRPLVEKYCLLPLNLLYINYFSCEMLFCSELLDLKGIVDTTLFYSEILNNETDERIKAFVHESRSKITPDDCIWFYGEKWDKLRKEYCPNLEVLSEVVEVDDSNPYAGRLRFFTFQKKHRI